MPSASFGYTGGYQYFTVPSGVTSVTVSVSGAGSGSTQGGRVTGTLAVVGGQKLVIVCGAAGKLASGNNGGATGWGGGGAGGDGYGFAGGDGGGGYSAIRIGTTSGTIKAVAGGAGGSSGDNGDGGEGGATTGGAGSPGTSGSNSTSNATGGTQSQGGNKGTSSSGSSFDGHNAADTVLAAYGGAGGQTTYYSHGGGGGGGGWHQGGGGQASSQGYAPGGGGGGGSNYTGGLTSASTQRGTGGTGGGNVTITYSTPAPANQRPNTPGTAEIDGHAESDNYPTKSTGSVTLSALLSDVDADDVRLLARYSANNFASYLDKYSGYVTNNHRASVTLTGLTQNINYAVRLYTQDIHGLFSTGYNLVTFWTNRKPVATPLTPAENASLPGIASVVFTWSYADPDPSDPQSGFELRYRAAATLTDPAGPWVSILRSVDAGHTWTINPGTFKGSTFYEWDVAVKDGGGLFGDRSPVQSFFISSISAPPVPTFPIKDEAIDAHQIAAFTWRFVDPDPGDAQVKADVRYRLVGQGDSDWVTVLGDSIDPGADGQWQWGPDQFVVGYHYEWQARTYDTIGGSQSDWSASGLFWTTGTPGEAVAGQPIATSPLVKGTLGCGTYEVFVYAQGGQQVIGQIDPLTALTFTRIRDGISAATITSNGFGADCGPFYGNIHCWLHEIVVFRDGERVWEGPITLITYQGANMQIQAQDVMVYAYRRIMRQGYNDSYQLLNGQQIGLPSVVTRAERILVNALAPYDPNVLPYLTTYQFSDDAKESRVVPDYSKTAWEEVDDLAATAGLDYTTIGRRIILWDTHRPIGRVPEMRDGDFSADPIISEYGMSLCNYAAVTNGSGIWGAATPIFTDPATLEIINGGFNHILHPGAPYIPPVQPWWQKYGPIEMLASAYGEAAGGGDETLTPAARAALVSSMASQARRNIGHRWPTPVIVRVPDNSTLHPECNVTFDQLVPGIWIPLFSEQFTRKVRQWQKLDSVTVTVDDKGDEKIAVVMSPAPNAGQDPDADASIAAAAAG